MKRVAAGLVMSGATAALLAAAVADADTWTPHYDFDNLDLVQSVARTQLAWAVPVTYTNTGTGATVSGIDYIRPSEGGPNNEFVADDGAIFALDKQLTGLGLTTEYYAPGPHNPAGSFGILNGTTHLDASMSWLVQPADYTNAVTFDQALDKVNPDLADVLKLGLGNGADPYAVDVSDYGTMTPFTVPDATAPVYGLPWWGFQDASFSNGDQTLHGTAYLMSPLGGVGLYNAEFVTTSGAIYDVAQWGWGFTNLYYNPGDGGAVVDMLKTPLGEWNMSWLSWLFAAPDYSHADFGATPAAMLDAADLSNILTQGMDAATQG